MPAEFIIVTGLCGSGKSTYCDGLEFPVLKYDDIFSYADSSLSTDKIDKIILDQKIVYLDAFNNDLLEYIKNKNPNCVFKCVFLYTSVDDYHNILAIKAPREFMSNNDFTYDGYILNIKNSIKALLKNINLLVENNTITEITYVYRNQNTYINHTDDTHLSEILNIDKKNIALNYIDEVSGHSSYQSIILDKEYIKKGSEKDWLSFENILKCTSLKDKVICDTGCFNGYFSFRCVEEGSKKVIGIDHNEPAIKICRKICIWNNYHLWNLGTKKDVSCEEGVNFHLKKLGKDKIFDGTENIDVIFALNYLHHLKNELGLQAFKDTIDSFFKNSKEVIFEINEPEIEYIENIAKDNKFNLIKKIESHRKTSFGNRWILHFK